MLNHNTSGCLLFATLDVLERHLVAIEYSRLTTKNTFNLVGVIN